MLKLGARAVQNSVVTGLGQTPGFFPKVKAISEDQANKFGFAEIGK